MSKIRDIRLLGHQFDVPKGGAYGTARGLVGRRNCSLVEVTLEDGAIGYGEIGGPVRQLAQQMALVKPFFVGKSAFDFEVVAAQTAQKLYHFGIQGLLTPCMTGISIASLDALGKLLKQPVYNLLGGKSVDRVKCYATTAYFSEGGMKDYARQLEVAAENFPAVKIKLGAGPKDDLARVELARRILGPDALLMVDANCNYTVDTALLSMRAIADHDIYWYEEPLPTTDERGYGELRARAPMPIATGEALYTAHDFKRLLDVRGVDILQPSMIVGGGLGQAKAIATLAQYNNLRISPSVWGGSVALAAALHYTASLPEWPHTDHAAFPVLIEYDLGASAFREGFTSLVHPDKKGEMPVPTGPGLGIEIDLKAIAAYAVEI